MATRNRKIQHGNVSSTLNNRENFSSLRIPVTTSFFPSRSKSVDTFGPDKTQTSAAPFEISTGITNDSPEIILLSNFIPVYDDLGNLNKVGEVFQAKQESLLVSSNSSISSIINSEIYSQLVDAAIENRQDIESFCSNFARDIDDILRKFSIIKKKLDCREKIDEKDLNFLGIILPEKINSTQKGPVFDLSPSSIEEILFEKDSNNISKWTPTKAWIQIVLELKESFRNGLPFLLSDSDASSIPADDVYKSPYDIVSPRSAFIKKMKFNVDRQILAPIFFNVVPVSSNDISESIKQIRPLFDLKNQFGIFNKSVFSDTDNLDESIARLSHLICKEYVYSTKLKSSVLVDYGYTFNLLEGNTQVWDYLFGQVGSDITDIPVNPLGAGKSLISLSQYVEADNSEVLSFEDNYIKDNIGSKRPGSVITPGTFYYIESSINTTTSQFDTSRIESYVLRLKSAIDMLSMLKNDLAFKADVSPYLTVSQKITKSEGGNSNSISKEIVSRALEGSRSINKKDVESIYQKVQRGVDGVRSSGKTTDFKDSLSNPILLLRSIEQKILEKSNLLKRNPGPRIWTSRPLTNSSKSPRQLRRFSMSDDPQSMENLSASSNLRPDVSKVGVLPTTREALDVSPLLISAALEDSDLMSLLFLYVASEVSSIKSSKSQNVANQTPTENSTIKSSIANKILERLKELYEKNISRRLDLSQQGESGVVEKVSSLEIYQSLINEDPAPREILNNLSKLIEEFIQYFEALEKQSSNLEKFFLSNIATPQVNINRNNVNFRQDLSDTKSSYSGVQKTVYIAAIFELCCLMVHAANPERITSSDSNLLGADFIVSLVKNPVFDNSEEIKTIRETLGNENTLPLIYDSIIVKCENALSSYDRLLMKQINRVYGFTFSLYKELESFTSDLQGKSGNYSSFISLANSLIKDPALVSLLMSEEQMLLIRSKLYDVLNRANLSYDSEIKRTIPYFLDLKENQNVDHFLPIEDVHLISWNLLLKDFLKSTGFRETDGFNKKIISIGIPQRLHRFLQKDASKLRGSSRRNKLIKIHIFRIDNLKPDLVYKPLTYLFDLRRFPTRVLKNYVDSGLAITGNQNLDLSKIPILNAVLSSDSSAFNSFSIVNDQNKSFEEYQFLSDAEKQELIQNHSMNFLMEEYLNYFAGTSFDEQKYSRYDVVKESIDTEFSKFVNETTGISVQSFGNPSIESFFAGETFLSNTQNLKSFLITPKKFDRVFHVMFDPDDFDVDKELTETEIWRGKYDIENVGRTSPGTISFDKYYVAVESYDEKEPKV